MKGLRVMFLALTFLSEAAYAGNVDDYNQCLLENIPKAQTSDAINLILDICAVKEGVSYNEWGRVVRRIDDNSSKDPSDLP
ncbi:hypothetical protein KUW00_15520 [Halomonas sp. DP5N14-9]|uniref:hypothetical protein n=1 Tax=Halomonas sp. DP5N14-9 TaxID=2859075 RepID=UPI001C99EFA4|nr:hypothetical protein [Halomonas sp. DP5N14-9]MBY5942288.1 hypothetical protein [Halomonas sp. DP5N14-9]